MSLTKLIKSFPARECLVSEFGNRIVLDGGSAHILVSLKKNYEKGTASPANGKLFQGADP